MRAESASSRLDGIGAPDTRAGIAVVVGQELATHGLGSLVLLREAIIEDLWQEYQDVHECVLALEVGSGLGVLRQARVRRLTKTAAERWMQMRLARGDGAGQDGDGNKGGSGGRSGWAGGTGGGVGMGAAQLRVLWDRTR